jgi:PAS domain-containing protein
VFTFCTVLDFSTLKETEYTEFHVKSNGRYYSIDGKTLSWNGIPSYILYISDETEAKQQHIRLQELVNNVPAGIGIYEINDGVTNLTYLNDAYYKMLGFKRGTRAYLMGKNSTHVVYAM